MTPGFTATVQPPRPRIESLADLDPANPFNTPSYAEARAASGDLPCLLALQRRTSMVSGCLGFLRGSFLNRALEIVSMPNPEEADVFWDGVRSFCRQHGVWDLYLESFGSSAAAVPELGPEVRRRLRCEYVLDLTGGDPLGRMSTNHRRNLARAARAGLRLRRTKDPEAGHLHVRLMNASMERRKARGEAVVTDHAARPAMALLASGAGELFQTLHGPDVVSSILVLRARCGGYYHSAGTLPAGMELGASSFAVAGVAEMLMGEGAHVFNLGGVGPDSPGLERFKAGFGARGMPLQAAVFSMASPIRRTVRTVVTRLLRRGPRSGPKRT